jgi:BirA family biotin operon repressor/biotin-[acetyl-CoA-carboxylase] ligase
MQHRPIDQARIRQAVEAQGCDWHYREQTGSTNADAMQYHARHGRDVVAFSEAQSAGRGRRGRQWKSPFARNIYCTVGVSRAMPAASQGLLSIVTGIALCRVLRRETGLAIALKWPNDLLLDDRKLGGILIESRALADERFFFAIGFGLNLCMSDAELAALDRPATSLDRHLGESLDRSALLQAVIDSVITAIRAFEVASAPRLIAEFAGFDAYHEAAVEVVSAAQRVSGINRGIDANGQLRLETGQGIELHSAAEISLRVPGE